MKQIIQITAAELKTAAYLLMILNHVMYALFPKIPGAPAWVSEIHWFITRPSFVLFAFLLSEGMVYSRNRHKYLARLGLLALLSEIPFDLALHGGIWVTGSQNVFFTLFLAAFAITAAEELENEESMRAGICLAACAAAVLLRSDYDALGVALVLVFYYYRHQRGKCLFLAACLLFFGMGAKALWDLRSYGWLWDRAWYYGAMELHGALAFPLILLYHGEKGRQLPKSIYYAIYPVHLLLIALIKAVR